MPGVVQRLRIDRKQRIINKTDRLIGLHRDDRNRTEPRELGQADRPSSCNGDRPAGTSRSVELGRAIWDPQQRYRVPEPGFVVLVRPTFEFR